MVVRIAVWSTPRARAPFLLRALDARQDTFVSDEPLAGLSVTHVRRLGLSAGTGRSGQMLFEAESDREWQAATARLSGRAPQRADIWVQKHVANQLLPHVERDWLRSFRHVFLLACPRGLIARAIASGGSPRIEDTTLPHQLEVFRWVEDNATTRPLVICDDLCAREPATMLPDICGSLGVPFDMAMFEPASELFHPSGAYYAGESPAGVDSIPLEYEGLVSRCEAMVEEMLQSESRAYC